MEMEGLGKGLEALAVFLFLAAFSLGGIWYRVRKREAQHETLRRMIERVKTSIRHSWTSCCVDKRLA